MSDNPVLVRVAPPTSMAASNDPGGTLLIITTYEPEPPRWIDERTRGGGKGEGVVTRCHLCGGKTEQQRVTAENWWGEQLALAENVPAWVCSNCGEKYFDADVCKQLDQLCRKPPDVERTLEVPVYVFRPAA